MRVSRFDKFDCCNIWRIESKGGESATEDLIARIGNRVLRSGNRVSRIENRVSRIENRV